MNYFFWIFIYILCIFVISLFVYDILIILFIFGGNLYIIFW